MGEFTTEITSESRQFGFKRKGADFSIEGNYNANKTESTYFLDGTIFTEPTHVTIGSCYTNGNTNININNKEYNNLFGAIATQLNLLLEELAAKASTTEV